MWARGGTDEQLQVLIDRAAYRLTAVLERRAVLDDSQSDPLERDSPLLTGLAHTTVQLCPTGHAVPILGVPHRLC